MAVQGRGRGVQAESLLHAWFMVFLLMLFRTYVLYFVCII